MKCHYFRGRASSSASPLFRDVADPFALYHCTERTSSTTKLSPSLPHRTTLSSCGFSNILTHTKSVSSNAILHANGGVFTCIACEPRSTRQHRVISPKLPRRVTYKVAGIGRLARLSVHRVILRDSRLLLVIFLRARGSL